MAVKFKFKSDIKNPLLPVVFDLSKRNKPLIIAFGGMAGALEIPPFEFFNLTKKLKVNRIYLRDFSQTWYHSGILGESGNIEDRAIYLANKIKNSEANKVVLFGNSMGGYAAILFGILINADIVHAFVPQTSLFDVGHVRYKNKIMHVKDTFDNKYFDLRRLIESSNNLCEIK